MVELITGKRENNYWKEESVYDTLPTTGLILLKNCIITNNVIQNYEEVNNDGTDSNLLSYEIGTEDTQLTMDWN